MPINIEKQRKRIRLFNRSSRKKLREKIVLLLGGKCVRCGFSDPRALQIDHVNGDGHRELVSLFGLDRNGNKKVDHYLYYKHILRKIQKGSKDYQLLCANCNWIKRDERHEVYNGKS